MILSKIEQRDIFLILVFGLMVIASAADIISDLNHGASTSHVVQEAILLGCSLIAILLLLIDLVKQKIAIQQLTAELKAARSINQQPEEYIVEAKHKLADSIRHQFKAWSLTPSETEVGWLLLKGLSLKEIAIIRETHEKTVRQQASAIYKKADLAGRHAFSAWFIEDIL